MKREGKRSAQECVNYAMILMLTAGRNATPTGEKKRKPVPVSAPAGDDSRQFGYMAVYRQGQREPHKYWLPTYDLRGRSAANAAAKQKRDAMIARFTKITFFAAAHNSWNRAFKKAVGRDVGNSAPPPGAQKETIEVYRCDDGHSVILEVRNLVAYILKLVPGIEQRMVDSATHRLQARLDGLWQAGIDRADRK